MQFERLKLEQELEALLESPSNGVRDEVRIARLQKELAQPLHFDERDEMEEFLVDDDYQYIMHRDSGLEYLRDLLSTGFVGYCKFSDQELITEVKQRIEMKEYL
jgi:hypothetical protein